MATLVQGHLATDVGKPTLGLRVIAQQHEKTRAVRKDSAAIHVRQRSGNCNQPGERGPYMQAEANKKARTGDVLRSFQRSCQRYACKWSAQHQERQAPAQRCVVLITYARLKHGSAERENIAAIRFTAACAPAQMDREIGR